MRASHVALFTETRGRVVVACTCGKMLGKHGSWPDARQAHDAHLMEVRKRELADHFNGR